MATPTAVATLPAAVGAQGVADWRHELRRCRQALRERFEARSETARTLREHARVVDRVLRIVYEAQKLPAGIAVLAVGGYGRGQLFPHSDVDVLLLQPDALDGAGQAKLERFLATLWDVGLEVGHSVRTIAECRAAMAADTTVRTNLLEHRLVAGSRALYRDFRRAFAETLDIGAFYSAKVLEQQQRHLKHRDAAYALEPNVKESPGGLRDLQTVLWIARAAGFGRTWNELAKAGLMTPAEARAIARQENLIGELRVRLHYLAGRREDRLVFDQQAALARQVGLVDSPSKRASEQLMQRYYRAAKLVRQVNTLLLQNLHARIMPIGIEPRAIDDEFVAIDELLHVRDERVFERRPGAMLDAFLIMQRHPELRGMSARTMRALLRNRRRIDGRFRRDPLNRATFLAILRQPRGITHELRRMHLFGILGAYIPAFGRIVGQMQHDLFHIYTVDEHILMLIRHLRRLALAQHAHEYPLCSQLMADFERKEVLFFAGLFHDIAKGRGGDHSQLGARDALRFSREHGLPRDDADLVAWLVENHLAMSAVAQKQDTSDPAVIEAFARRVRDERRLVALYLLTVADIRATNPKIWNAWKSQLLEELFLATRAVLAGDSATSSLRDSLQERETEAKRLLRLYAVPEEAERGLWRHLDTTYFQRHSADEIAWHARHLYWRVDRTDPVVKARLAKAGAGLQILVYVPDQKELFARICGFIGRTGLSIVDAKVHTTRHGFALDTFIVHDPGNPSAAFRNTIQYIEHELTEILRAHAPVEPPPPGRVSRQLRHFPLSPEVQIFPDDKGAHYILEIVAGDRPGLLARIAYVLAKANINVYSAKINTLGERAEDVFLIDGARLSEEQEVVRLETAIYESIKIGAGESVPRQF